MTPKEIRRIVDERNATAQAAEVALRVGDLKRYEEMLELLDSLGKKLHTR